VDVFEQSRVITHKTCPLCKRDFPAGDESAVCPDDGTLLGVVASDPLIGQIVAGHYEILEPLGAGGWSLVYKARQKPINRLVAVKILHSHLVKDPEKVARFQREAEAASSLLHPHVAAVFDYGLLPQGQPFIVMEYMEGKALSEVLEKEGALPLSRAMQIFMQACQGLGAAHEKGVVHRDIKPSNIFLAQAATGEEIVKILDFGLAKLVLPDEGRGNLTQTGETMGTPDYMSPEQCLAMNLDARTDIYTLGYVMYETLTGRQAVVGKTTYDSMNAHIHDMPMPFAEANPKIKIPEAVEAVVFKALAKDPSDRYQSCAELHQALANAYKDRGGFLKKLSYAAGRRRARGKRASSPTSMIIPVGAAALALLIGWRYFELHNNLAPRVGSETQVDLRSQWKALKAQAEDDFNREDYQGVENKIKKTDGVLSVAEKLGDQDDALTDTLKLLRKTEEKLGHAGEIKDVDARLKAISERYYWKEWGTVDENSRKITELFGDLANDPNNKKIAEELALTFNKQCALLMKDNKYDQAEALIQRALKMELRVLGDKDPEYARSIGNLGAIYFDTGRNDEAGKLLRKCLSIREEVLGPMDPLVARSCRILSDYCERNEQFAESEALLKRAMNIYQQAQGKYPQAESNYAWCANNLGLSYFNQGKLAQARQMMELSLKVRERIDGPDSIDGARAFNNLGLVDMKEKNYKSAKTLFERALSIFKTKLDNQGMDAAQTQFNLGSLYLEMGDYPNAEANLIPAFNICRRLMPTSRTTIDAFQALMKTYQAQHKIDEMRALTKLVNSLPPKAKNLMESDH
jgi:serine/threonine protein kinase/Tfp pilus assembly protein PilF